MFLAEALPLVGIKGKNKAQSEVFADAFAKAVDAGLKAGAAKKPTPMIVTQHSNPMDDKSPALKEWYVPEGPCGFAWIKVSPGNSPFANWLKLNKFASKAYGGGVDIWISDFDQSVEQKEACASAMAKVLQMELGMSSIYAMSRLD